MEKQKQQRKVPHQCQLLGKVTEEELMKDAPACDPNPAAQKGYTFTLMEAQILKEQHAKWGRAFLFKDGQPIELNVNADALKDVA